ncbi:MAG: hypothetical protein GEU78_16915 [Actinobacteria bacterium]|nr:hypothetical protein [Actinomycetota bacterium]
MRALALPQDDAQLRFVLYFTKGLGDVAAAELNDIVPAATLLHDDERFAVVALTAAQAQQLGEQTRTIDDLRLLIAGPESVTSEDDFAALCGAAAKRVRQVLAQGDNPPDPWSVTLSARNPVWRSSSAWDPAPLLTEHFQGADLNATVRSSVDLRLQVEGETVHIALNLWHRPVGKRAHDASERPGALRPTVAAAVVRLALADLDPAITAQGVYDPFCGTGTIVAEAAHLGLPVFASDIDDQAVELTRQRLSGEYARDSASAAAELRHRVFAHDVRRGPAQRVTARIVVGNMPWGKQIKVKGRLALFNATALLVRHALGEGGSAALLTTHEDQLIARLRRQRLEVSSRRIGLLGQTPAIVTARKS